MINKRVNNQKDCFLYILFSNFCLFLFKTNISLAFCKYLLFITFFAHKIISSAYLIVENYLTACWSSLFYILKTNDWEESFDDLYKKTSLFPPGDNFFCGDSIFLQHTRHTNNFNNNK